MKMNMIWWTKMRTGKELYAWFENAGRLYHDDVSRIRTIWDWLSIQCDHGCQWNMATRVCEDHVAAWASTQCDKMKHTMVTYRTGEHKPSQPILSRYRMHSPPASEAASYASRTQSAFNTTHHKDYSQHIIHMKARAWQQLNPEHNSDDILHNTHATDRCQKKARTKAVTLGVIS